MAKHCEYEQQLRHMKMSIEEMREVIDKHSTIKHWAYIIHDKDVREDGSPKEPHIHLTNVGQKHLYRDPHAESECIDEYLALVNIGQLRLTVIELFEDLFLLVRERAIQIVVVLGDVLHQLFDFLIRLPGIKPGAYVAVKQFFEY